MEYGNESGEICQVGRKKMNSTEGNDNLESWAPRDAQPNGMLEKKKSHPGLSEPLSIWESLAERKIKEAQEQGLFDDLPGKGKPLDLSENPFLDPSWRIAFKLLQDHGFAPEWIELDKEIRAELGALRRQLAESKCWYARAMASLEDWPGCEARQGRAWIEAYWERKLSYFATWIIELNKKIGLFNLKVPIVRLQRRKVSIDEELQRLNCSASTTEGANRENSP